MQKGLRDPTEHPAVPVHCVKKTRKISTLNNVREPHPTAKGVAQSTGTILAGSHSLAMKISVRIQILCI